MVRADDLVASGLERNGEACPVRVGPGDRLDGLDHDHADHLVEREQSPDFLLKSAWILGPQDPAGQEGVAQ